MSEKGCEDLGFENVCGSQQKWMEGKLIIDDEWGWNLCSRIGPYLFGFKAFAILYNFENGSTISRRIVQWTIFKE